MDDEEPDLQEWVTYRKKKIDKKMLGDKYKLVKKLDFSSEEYEMAKKIVKTQEDISKQLVSQFEEFLLFFNIEADIEIHNGHLMAKVTEFADNVYLVRDGRIIDELHRK